MAYCGRECQAKHWKEGGHKLKCEEFKAKHYLSDDDLEAMKKIEVPSERLVQDYRSTYNDTRDWLRRQKDGEQQDESTVDWDDVVFEAQKQLRNLMADACHVFTEYNLSQLVTLDKVASRLSVTPC